MILRFLFGLGLIIILLCLFYLHLCIRNFILQKADTGHNFRNLAGQLTDLCIHVILFPGKIIDLIIHGIQLALGAFFLVFFFLPLLLKVADTGSICCLRHGYCQYEYQK